MSNSLLRVSLAEDLAANAGGEGRRAMIWGWLLNPGFSAIALHRVSVHLQRRGYRRLGWLLWAINTRRTGCHFHPDAVIGARLFLPHPTGVVIGSGVRVGNDVCLYQGVTLGRNLKGEYPRIEAGAVLFPNAVVVGNVRIGTGSVVGATAMVQRDVPDGATLVVNQAQTIRLAASGAAGQRLSAVDEVG